MSEIQAKQVFMHCVRFFDPTCERQLRGDITWARAHDLGIKREPEFIFIYETMFISHSEGSHCKYLVFENEGIMSQGSHDGLCVNRRAVAFLTYFRGLNESPVTNAHSTNGGEHPGG